MIGTKTFLIFFVMKSFVLLDLLNNYFGPIFYRFLFRNSIAESNGSRIFFAGGKKKSIPIFVDREVA